jgi:hypothetical protein
MADRKYTFKTIKKPDGSLGYYVNGTELQDKTAYDRIKQQTNQAADQDLADEETKFDSAVNKPSSGGVTSELDSMFKKAKGGIIKSSASSRADGCVTKGKTKGRFV